MKTLIVALLLSAPPVIDGPAEVPAGTPVVLATTVEENAAYYWQLLDSEQQLKVFSVCPEGAAASQICLLPTTSAGVYRVQLIRASIDEETVKPVIDVVTHNVTIGEPPPTPDPMPAPQPDVIEVTIAELAANVGDAATAVNLGAVFKILAGQNHASVDAMVKATEAAVKHTVAGKKEDWKQFLSGLDVVLTNLKEEGELKTVDDHKRVWSKIATGLMTVQK